MDERDTIPWSQQVDEDLYDSPSYSPKNKSENKLWQSFECVNLLKRDGKYGIEQVNSSNVPHNTSKGYSTYKMSAGGTQKAFSGDTFAHICEPHDKSNSSPDNSLLTSSEPNINKKKITWASIASQPAKPNKRNNIALKKKGPGMPPPPMIPGKHSLSVNPWDLTKNPCSIKTPDSVSNFIPTKENPSPSKNDLSAKWKPQSSEQSSNISRKQPNAYNKSFKNAKSYGNPLEFEIDQSLVPKPSEEQNQNLKKIKAESIPGSQNSFRNISLTRSSAKDLNVMTLRSDCLNSEIVLKQLKDRNNYNPIEIDMQKAALSRYFVIKSYSEDDIHRSIKYEIWCSTDHGNKRLDEAFKERTQKEGNIMLFFSVNGSGHFCGMAQMMTPVDYKSTASVWSQDKWKGKFKVKWIYVKDVPNSQLRHIRLENNENKSVTNSRDTQEIPLSQGLQMLKIIHLYKHLTSIFDDFHHYDKKQEESFSRKPTQFDNNISSLSGPNTFHSDGNEKSNDCPTVHFKERTTYQRGEHSNTPRNRRYGKSAEAISLKDEPEKANAYINSDRQDNEVSKYILKEHSNPSMEKSSTKCNNYKENILYVNSLNCNENSIVKENSLRNE